MNADAVTVAAAALAISFFLLLALSGIENQLKRIADAFEKPKETQK